MWRKSLSLLWPDSILILPQWTLFSEDTNRDNKPQTLHTLKHRHHWARLMTSLMWSQNPLPNFQCCYPFILLAGMIWAKLNLVSQWAPREPEWDFSFYMPSNSVGLSKLIWGTFWCLLLWCFWQDSTDFFLFDLFLKPFQALWFCQIIASQETRFLHFLMQMCIVKLTATCVRVLLAVLDNTVAAISEASF